MSHEALKARMATTANDEPGAAVEGMLLVDKPSGPTSHDVVEALRRLTGQKRIGHAGTLDPMASGLLPLMLGRATRLVRFLPHSPKRYLGRLRLGVATDTDDVTGSVIARHEGGLPTEAVVIDAATSLTGRLLQSPPAYSARRVGGERMYRLSRLGRTVEGAPSEIEVSRLDLRPGPDPAEWSFETVVSTGTYVRALVRDLGRRLGTGAVLVALRRTAVGPLDLERSIPLPPPDAEPARRSEVRHAVVPLDALPLAPATIAVEPDEAVRRFLSGSRIRLPSVPSGGDGPRRVVDGAGRLLGIGVSEADVLRPEVVLRSPARRLAGSGGPVLSSARKKVKGEKH